MPKATPFQHVSEAPTHPGPKPAAKVFDVADLYKGPVTDVQPSQDGGAPMDEKLRQA